MDYIQLAFDLLGNPWIRGVVGLIVVGVIFFSAIVMVWLERKFLGDIQTRPGPNRVGGRFGLLQLVADAIKLFTKEDIVPENADKPVHAGGPIVALTSAFLMAVAVPYGVVSFEGSEYLLAVTTMDISALYVEAVAAVSIIALFMAGWGSNNKYSLLGAFRNIARMLGYEVPLGLAVLSVAVMAQSLDFVQIVSRQEQLAWFIFMQPLGFIVFGVALLADLGRIPFDQIEAEEELIAGVFTEYSSMRWGFAFFAEYLHAIVGACLVVILFLGGWSGLPFLGTLFIPPVLWFVGKVFVVIMVMIWIRGALPRVRIDQVTDLGWKVLFPYSLINLVWAAAVAMVVS
ncbi:MAG TPA: NADH-quinone oxidoreductase subunit NuoH [Candidatus Methanoperedenaceae archaeon]|nr:NADH-quinone oxidoreductase subunit NuoH [Candidatus Methanoperedenaceae archaeon]